MAVYMDNAATTRVTEQVVAAMLPYFTQLYGNPSSLHGYGRKVRRAIDTARAQASALLGCEPGEVYFTACGSEADNWALRGVAHSRGAGHIITTQIEHPAVLQSAARLEGEGFRVTYLPVDSHGFVDPDDLRAAMTPDTILVSVMTANNELGSIEPIGELAGIAHAGGALFHTDAVQAAGHIPLDVNALGVDLLSVSGHKLHAPKGIGCLYIRKGTRIDPFMLGGSQEMGMRAGTENAPYIVGLGRAMELAANGMQEREGRVRALRDMLVKGVTERLANVECLTPEHSLPGHASLCFADVEGEALLLNLDLRGIAVSSGSACASGSTEISHVLRAIGLPYERARGTIRFSLGDENTGDEVREVIEALVCIVPRLRAAVGK